MRSSACDTLSRFCARHVLCWPAFPSVPALRSTGSAAGCPALFVGFLATMAESDFPGPCIIGYGSSPSQCGPARSRTARRGTSRFPPKELRHMPGSSTPPGRQALRFRAWLCCLPPSKQRRRTGIIDFVAQWLAYVLPFEKRTPLIVGAVPQGTARPGRPPEPGRRSSDRCPPQP